MKQLVIIGSVWPEPQSTAAGSRMLQLISLFQEQGYDVTFMCSASQSDYSYDLSQISVRTQSIELNNVSFDLEIAKLGWNIVMVDPLKEACEYAQTHLSKFDRISIFNACLWKFDGVVNIYTPRDSSSNSYSITNEWHTDQVIDSKSVSLLTLLTKIENANVDNVYIKIDIEGAELELFEDLIKWQKRFDFLGIELDSLHLVPFLSVGTRFRRLVRVIAQLRKMRRNNWQFVHREGFNFFFVTNRKCII